jgi:hypothetical protein
MKIKKFNQINEFYSDELEEQINEIINDYPGIEDTLDSIKNSMSKSSSDFDCQIERQLEMLKALKRFKDN